MLEFISKHTLIPVHRNINILGLRGLNITFLIVFYPSLQSFGWTGPVKLLVKFLTSSEIVAFGLVQREQTTVQTTVLFFFYSEKKKSLCKIFLTVKNHQGGINYGRMFFLLSTTHYFWTFSMRRALFLLFEGKHLMFYYMKSGLKLRNSQMCAVSKIWETLERFIAESIWEDWNEVWVKQVAISCMRICMICIMLPRWR